MPKSTLTMRRLFVVATLLCAASATAAQPGAVAKIFQWRPFLAPFHAVVLHFPIGFLTAAFLLELYRFFRPSDELRRITFGALLLSLVTGIISATFGLMRATSGDYDANTLQLHRLFGLGVPTATLIAFGLKIFAESKTIRPVLLASYRATLATSIVLVIVAGHLGGNLTHGSRYLVENAPEFVKNLLDERPTTALPSTGYFKTKVQPILASKCYGCHGPDKQKGGYRLDQPRLALEGGKSGATAIKPGNPLKSHLIELILLPPTHDDVMPPDGKEPLKPEEIMTIIDWVRNGAPFDTEPQLAAQTRATPSDSKTQ